MTSVIPMEMKKRADVVTDGEILYAWFGTGQLVALDLGGDVIACAAGHLGDRARPFKGEGQGDPGAARMNGRVGKVPLAGSQYRPDATAMADDPRDVESRSGRDLLDHAIGDGERAGRRVTRGRVSIPGGPAGFVLSHDPGSAGVRPDRWCRPG